MNLQRYLLQNMYGRLFYHLLLILSAAGPFAFFNWSLNFTSSMSKPEIFHIWSQFKHQNYELHAVVWTSSVIKIYEGNSVILKISYTQYIDMNCCNSLKMDATVRTFNFFVDCCNPVIDWSWGITWTN